MECEPIVQARPESALNAVVGRWVTGVMAGARWVLLAWALVIVGASVYAVNNLGLDADVANMVSPELPVRKAQDQYQQAFPPYTDLMVLVVEGRTPERVEDATATLAARLESDQNLFRSVYVPGAGFFFERHGLLYLDLDDLVDLTDRIAAAQPVLGKLAADFSLRGLFNTLTTVIEHADQDHTIDLAPILDAIDITLASALAGHHPPLPLSWRAVLQQGAPDDSVQRGFILVQPWPDYSTLFPVGPAMAAIRDAAQAMGIDEAHGLRLRITGGLPLEHEEMQTVTKGAGLALMLALLLVSVILFVGLRSLRMILASLLTLVAGLIVTTAFAAAAIGHLNMISVAFAVLNIGLGIDFAIHFCMRYLEGQRHPQPSARLLIDTAKHVAPSLMLCAATTAAGFYAFIPTPYVGVGELGIIAGTGVFISLLASLTLLPALLHLWKPQSPSPVAHHFSLPTAFLEFPLRHRRVVLMAAMVLVISAGFILPSARFDYNPLNLRDPDSESVATFKTLLEDPQYAPLSAVVLAEGKQALADLSTRLQALPEVKHAISIASFVPDRQREKLAVIEELNLILGPGLLDIASPSEPVSTAQQREAIEGLLAVLQPRLMEADDSPFAEAMRRLQSNLQAILQHLAAGHGEEALQQWLGELEQALLGSLPGNLERLDAALRVERPVAAEALPASLVQRWVSGDDLFRIEVVPQEDIADTEALRRFVTALQSVAPDVTDEPVQMLVVGDTIIVSFQQAFGLACLAVMVMVLVGLRSVSGAALVVAALLFGAMLTGAVLVLVGIPFNFANVIALPLLLGMGVDNGIHLLRRLRLSGDPSKIAVMYSSTPRAMVLSALTTVASFGNLSFSAHPGTASLGLVLVIGIIMMLGSTLFLIPALYTAWQARRR